MSNETNRRAKSAAVVRFAKRSYPLMVCLLIGAVRCFAAQSPMARWLQDLRAEATGTWAIAGSVIGLVIGLLGMKFGDSHGAKGKFASLAILCFLLLSVEGVVAYLQSE